MSGTEKTLLNFCKELIRLDKLDMNPNQTYRNTAYKFYPKAGKCAMNSKNRPTTKANVFWKSQALLAEEEKREVLIKECTYEHAVPCRVIIDILVENEERLTEELCQQVFDKYAVLCLVLKSEDKKLEKAGLFKKMPQGWKYGDSPWARYEAVGIVPVAVNVS